MPRTKLANWAIFECDGSCNHYRGQDPEASPVVISGAKQTTASGPTIARLRRSFVLHRQHKLGWPWRRLPLLSSHAGYWKYDKSEILQLKFEFCSAQIHNAVPQCVTVHRVPKFTSCHNAIIVVTGRAHCSSLLCVCVYIYIYIYTIEKNNVPSRLPP